MAPRAGHRRGAADAGGVGLAVVVDTPRRTLAGGGLGGAMGGFGGGAGGSAGKGRKAKKGKKAKGRVSGNPAKRAQQTAQQATGQDASETVGQPGSLDELPPEFTDLLKGS